MNLVRMVNKSVLEEAKSLIPLKLLHKCHKCPSCYSDTIRQVNKGWNHTAASSRWGSGQEWEQATTYSLFVLLPIQVFA